MVRDGILFPTNNHMVLDPTSRRWIALTGVCVTGMLESSSHNPVRGDANHLSFSRTQHNAGALTLKL
ncbi:hypothetical protein MTR_7g115680 [Medicago truncatula]|uniref:Uncharacterized protein n=1 Tax=Medicago truncatula TaxID=3880 RepID=A0A072U625_MEDTR|nr:hypothetical protein MTR_7g115680 [Medicago truncatula]